MLRTRRNTLERPSCLSDLNPSFQTPLCDPGILLCTGSLPNSVHWSHWRKTAGLQEGQRNLALPVGALFASCSGQTCLSGHGNLFQSSG